MNQNDSFSRTQFPPGGWIFFQSQTGWSNPSPMMHTFDKVVQLIVQMRTKNPALCIRHNLSRDPVSVANELENFTRLRCGWPLPQPVAPPAALVPGVPVGVVGTVDEIKRLAFGSGILIDWDESGQPQVPAEESERRAAVCAACPQNNLQKYEEWLRHPLANMLKSRLARLVSLKLHTAADSRLGLCGALFSPENMLVHEPAELVKKKMTQNPSVKLADCCWLK